jgi:hypothetical protein
MRGGHREPSLLLPITPFLGSKNAHRNRPPGIRPSRPAGPHSRYGARGCVIAPACGEVAPRPNMPALRRLRRRGGPIEATSSYSAPGALSAASACYRPHLKAWRLSWPMKPSARSGLPQSAAALLRSVTPTNWPACRCRQTTSVCERPSAVSDAPSVLRPARRRQPPPSA